MLKQLKQTTLSLLKSSGVFSLVRDSNWRRKRLLILAYHGISMDDESEWFPSLYMRPADFRSRLQLLKKSGCTVLPLHDALRRLYADELPERCVALTFDDGFHDFYKEANSILKEFNYPVTVYLTTFYSEFNRPVFDPVCSYLLWKGRHKTLDLTELTGQQQKADLSSEAARNAVLNLLQEFVRQHSLSAEEKDDLAARLAKQLHINYDALLAKRILHLLSPEEVKHLADDGVDFQLHTHRHRMPRDRTLFTREIEDNRNSIRGMTGSRASHFCAPNGFYDEVFFPWLQEMGIESATTCDSGLATPNSRPLSLPRLLDTSSLSPIEFEGWVTGVSTILPRRKLSL